MGVSIDLVFKIAAIGILIAVLYQLLVRSGREDIAMMVSIAGLVIVLLMVVDMVSGLFSSVKNIFGLY
ncbi:MAG: stage III sporulation protein AC [Clostridiales bacterium]|jgi:stage III sporulation protein AC|nr:stage III sporulation protein AC [Clostridiales bacterium]